MIEFIALFLLSIGMLIGRKTSEIKRDTEELKRYELIYKSYVDAPSILFDLNKVDFENTNIDDESDGFRRNPDIIYKYRTSVFEKEEYNEDQYGAGISYYDFSSIENSYMNYGRD